MKHDVKITTFKPSGKYYDSWNAVVSTTEDSWYEIIKAVRNLKQEPGQQRDMDWLIGMDDSRDDMYPVIIKGE